MSEYTAERGAMRSEQPVEQYPLHNRWLGEIGTDRYARAFADMVG
jgi:hypothetical protein